MILKVLHSLMYDTGLPRDVAVNTFHFDADVAATQAPLVAAAVNDFWSVTHGTFALAEFLSGDLNGNWSIKVYNLDDAIPRVPVFENEGTYAGVDGNTAMPSEVAMCLSYQANPTSGVSQRRRRGRIYIGPLSDGARASTAPGGQRPATPLIDVATAAATQLVVDSTDASAPWVVYHTSPPPVAAYPVSNGWVDNAFDTQRRRGAGVTFRTLWAA